MEGLKNFVTNIRPVILKVKNGEQLTNEEQNQIVQFYIEVSTIAFQS